MFAFPRQCKLRRKQDFDAVFAEASKVSYKYLLLLFRPKSFLASSPDSALEINNEPRLGLVISKQRVRKAVDRNHVRRIIRESFRHHKALLTGLDLIVLIRSQGNFLENASLREDIDRLWQMVKQKI